MILDVIDLTTHDDGQVERRFMTLFEALAMVGINEIPQPREHFIYEPDVRANVRVACRAQHANDMIITRQLFGTALSKLLQIKLFEPDRPPRDGFVPIYRIGRIRHARIYGHFQMPYAGVRESVTVPVRIDWAARAGVLWRRTGK